MCHPQHIFIWRREDIGRFSQLSAWLRNVASSHLVFLLSVNGCFKTDTESTSHLVCMFLMTCNVKEDKLRNVLVIHHLVFLFLVFLWFSLGFWYIFMFECILMLDVLMYLVLSPLNARVECCTHGYIWRYEDSIKFV